jgi:RHS repeat-associated protein
LTSIAGPSGWGGCQTEGFNNLATTNNQLSQWCYDAAGNLLDMGGCAPLAHSYVYDAENQLQSPPVANTNGAMPYTYFYDGEGNRVQKCVATSCGVGSTGTLYWRGEGGEVLSESNRTGSMNEDYIYFNGARVARRDVVSNNVHYYFSDHLGSASVITDSSGNVQQQTDYYPYGGVVYSSGTDPNHYKFSGKETDIESTLDNFGARYYASAITRFMSVDPAFESEILELPQTWNRYSYVYNQPTYGTDPDGRCPPCIGALVGGLIEGGFDVGKQFIKNGNSFSGFNKQEFGASVLGGVVTGGLAVATGGASLVESAVVGDILAGGTANVVGGIVTRTAEGKDADEVLSGTELSRDALAGLVGGAGGHVAEEFVHVPGEPVFKGRNMKEGMRRYNKAVSRRDNAIVKQTFLGSFAHATAANLTSLFERLFSKQVSSRYHSPSEGCVEAHDSSGQGTGTTCN